MSNNGSTGAFTFFTAYGLRNIRDGAVNTIAFSEALAGDARVTNVRGNGVSGIGVGSSTNEVLDAYTALAAINTALNTCNSTWKAGTATNIANDRGNFWSCGLEGWTLFNTMVTPNFATTLWNSCRLDTCCQSAGNAHITKASSNHPGGVNTLLCDGSVKFVKDSVAQIVWMSVGTRDKGEVVTADAY